MKNVNLTTGMLVGLGVVAGLTGGLVIKNSKRSKLKTISKKAGKALDTVGTMLNDMSDMVNMKK